MSIKMTEDEYLAQKGFSFIVSDYNLDKIVLPHGETVRQWKRRIDTGIQVENEYQKKRLEAKQQYRRLVKRGEIIPKNRDEITYELAKGHPDNASTQAARRILSKKGYMMVYPD